MSSLPQSEPSKSLVAATVSFYIVSALSMVMANKWVLKTTPIPITFLFLQLFLAVPLLALCRVLRLKAFQFKLPYALQWEVSKNLIPMVALNVIGLTFNTLTLARVDASFYQIARGLVLPFTVMTSYMFLNSRPSLYILLACTAITAGFLVGILPTSSSASAAMRGFTTMGVVYGLISCLSTAFHVVVIKKSLASVQNSALDLSWYSNILTSVVLIPIVITIREHETALEYFTTASNEEMRTFVIGTLITGTFGFLLSVSGILSVKITSPITHMVSSAVRGVAQTILGAWLFSEIINISRATSVLIILAGSIWYTWIKHVESQSKPVSQGKEYSAVPMHDRDRDIERGKD